MTDFEDLSRRESPLLPRHRFAAILPLPTCRLGVSCAGPALRALVFLPPETPLMAAVGADMAAVRPFSEKLSAWIDDPQVAFDLPRVSHGTLFQQRTWQAISSIPIGEIRTYGALSAEIGGTARAIGQACGANPFPIIVPCHRVVAKTGLGGFANNRDGWLLETKRWLLKHEGVL